MTLKKKKNSFVQNFQFQKRWTKRKVMRNSENELLSQQKQRSENLVHTILYVYWNVKARRSIKNSPTWSKGTPRLISRTLPSMLCLIKAKKKRYKIWRNNFLLFQLVRGLCFLNLLMFSGSLSPSLVSYDCKTKGKSNEKNHDENISLFPGLYVISFLPW